MRPRDVDARRLIVWAALLGCLARAAFGLLYWHGKPLTHDEREYLALAANLAAGRGFTQTLPNEPPENPNVQQFGRAPLYPAFLAPLTLADADLRAGRMPADVPWSIKLAQSIIGALGVWLIGAIALQIAGARAGSIAALIAAIYPPLVWSSAFALSETLYSTLALACVWVLAPVLDGEKGWKGKGVALPALTGGLLTGLSILARPAMLFFLPFALLLAWRRRPLFAALLLGSALLIVLPWSARNVAVQGRFVLVASEGGVTFWTGNHPAAIGEGDLAANPHLKLLNQQLRARYASLSEEEMESIYYREAFSFITGHPVQWLGLLAKKLFYTWAPIGPSYRLHSARYFWTSVLSYGAVLPFAVLGCVWLWRHGRAAAPGPSATSQPEVLHLPRWPWTLWGLAGSALLVCLIFFPQERFRIPVVDPTLIICAAVWLARAK